jgi:acetolactate synthase-1/2/3 large subunit
VEKPPTVAACVARYLQNQGVERVYSLPGSHVKSIWAELEWAGVRVVSARSEGAAVHMAQAEADLTGRLGVAIATTGPGITNATTAVASAYLARSPLLVISARPPTAQTGMRALEEIPQAEIMRPICRDVQVVVGARTAVGQLDLAVAAAIGEDGPSGPVYLEFPSDLLPRPAHPPYGGEATYAPRTRPVLRPDAAAVVRAAERLRGSRRPLVIGGRAVVETPDLVARLIEATGALYLDTRESRGAISSELEAYVPAQRARAMAEADLVITLGRILDFELAYGSPAVFRSGQAFIRFGRTLDELSLNRRADVEVRADVRYALDELLGLEIAPTDPDAGWRSEVVEANRERAERLVTRMAEAPAGEDGRMHPYTLLRALNEVIDDDTIVVVDGGDILSFARIGLRTPTYLDLGAFGCLGVGVPFAIAASLTYPGRRVIALVGDGSFGFNGMELETAAREGASVVVVVANNRAWNIERSDSVTRHEGRPLGGALSDCSYDLVARGLGVHGQRVDDPEQLGAALASAFEHAPALIDVAVTAEPISSDARAGMLNLPSLHALQGWNDAEMQWLMQHGLGEETSDMAVTIHQPAGREAPRGYSEATSGRGVVAVAGQLPAEDVLARGGAFHEQYVSALTRFIEVVEASGSTPADVLMIRIYITSLEAYKAELKQFGGAYRDAFGGRYPAATMVEVSGLVDERAMVEIEGLAVAP